MPLNEEPLPQPMSLQDLDQIQAATQQKVEQLYNAVHSLPKVDNEGHSECPFAEDLYAKKNKLEQEVSHMVCELHMYLAWIGEELSRGTRNLAVLAEHQRRLYGEGQRERYTEAEKVQQCECNDLAERRESILRLLEHATAVLHEAAKRQFPGRVPRERQAPGLDSVTVGSKPVESNKEIDALVAFDNMQNRAAAAPTHQPDFGN